MKRIISLLLVMTLVLCSGVLTALPVAAETRTGITFTAADTDGNGNADVSDALNILKKVVGKIDKFPVEQ